MKLLIHACCAPCLVYPWEVLVEEGMEPEGFFYNPNIHPAEEHRRRMEALKEFARVTGAKIHYSGEFMQERWEGFSGPGEERCAMCYTLRMAKAAAYAKEKGFDAFTTSLLVSPYQKHDLIKALGDRFAREYGVAFYYRDFRPGFRQGQRKAKEMGLYRQKYCGCIISLGESGAVEGR